MTESNPCNKSLDGVAGDDLSRLIAHLQAEDKFINKVTATFILDSYEEFAKKELQEPPVFLISSDKFSSLGSSLDSLS